MSYRDVSESLRAYRDRVAGDLDEARRAAKEASERAAKVSVLEKELAETESLLAKMGGKRRGLPLLDEVQIAAPCTASWDAMVGDEHVRFCGKCEKNVYNLSSLPREEAEALLAAKEGKMCVRLYTRADGTVLTADCPVGVKKRRRRRAAFGAVGASLMAAAGAFGLAAQGRHTMGDPLPARPTDTGSIVTAGAITMPEVPQVDPASTGTPHVVPTSTATPHIQPMMGAPRAMQGVRMGKMAR
jgi:hypothetical protein